MTCYRSTAIAAADRCPAAVDYAQSGARVPKSWVAAGVAAHAWLQVRRERSDLSADAVGIAVGERLIGVGRMFEGRDDGGYPPTRVWEGIELARAWAAGDELAGGGPEVQLYGRHDWRLTADVGAARWSATIDNLSSSDEPWVEAYEYKTSWQAGRSWLDGPQARVQIALLWSLVEANPRCEGLVMTLVNLRTGGRWEREIARDDAAEVREIREQLTATANGLDRLAFAGGPTGPRGPLGRPKRPGPACTGCLWWHTCSPATDTAPVMTAEQWAATWVAAKLTADEAERQVKAAAAERPIDLPGGYRVGFERRESYRLRKDAAVRVAAAIPGLQSDERQAWAAALGAAGLTVTSLRRIGDQFGIDALGIAAEPFTTARLGHWETNNAGFRQQD